MPTRERTNTKRSGLKIVEEKSPGTKGAADMGTSLFHLRHQGPVIRSLLETGLRSLQGRTKPRAGFAGSLPGPVLEQTVSARPAQLVRDYLRHTGGDPSWYWNKPYPLVPRSWCEIICVIQEGIPVGIAASYPLTFFPNGDSRFWQRRCAHCPTT